MIHVKRYLQLAILTLVIWILFRKEHYDVKESGTAAKEDIDSDFDIRVVCIILTQVKNHKSRVRGIADTWGRRCKGLIYVTNSTIHLDDQRVYDIKKQDSYNTIWGKVKTALKYAYHHHQDDADWFIKADDDSYVIMENVEEFIHSKNIGPSDPTWFGTQYHLFSEHGYMAGGGYIMSKESVRRFVEVGLNSKNNKNCKATDDTGAEDAEMGKCMSSIGVRPTDSRDEYGRARSFPFDGEYITGVGMPNSNFWYWKNIKHPQVFGHPGCCSDTSMILHYVSVPNMYKYEFLLYGAKVRGEKMGKRPPPAPETLVKNMKIDWKEIQA